MCYSVSDQNIFKSKTKLLGRGDLKPRGYSLNQQNYVCVWFNLRHCFMLGTILSKLVCHIFIKSRKAFVLIIIMNARL